MDIPHYMLGSEDDLGLQPLEMHDLVLSIRALVQLPFDIASDLISLMIWFFQRHFLNCRD
jgi:hypothetical protein